MENPKSIYLNKVGVQFGFKRFDIRESWIYFFIYRNIHSDLTRQITTTTIISYNVYNVIDRSVIKLFKGIWITFTK